MKITFLTRCFEIFLGLKRTTCLPVLLGLMLTSAALQAEQTVRLVGDPWPPYVVGNLGEDAGSGIAVEIANRIFATIADAEVRFPLIPWNRALREVEAGSSDGIGALLKTDDREKYMEYTLPLLQGKSLVWAVTGDDGRPFEWLHVSDLKGYRLGVTQGYSYGEEIDQNIELGELDVVLAPSVEQLFAMLANDRIDIALANDAVGYSLAKLYPRVQIHAAEKIISTETFYMGISRKSPAIALIPRINQAILSMQENGQIDRIIRGE